jgi:hypothetical protein
MEQNSVGVPVFTYSITALAGIVAASVITLLFFFYLFAYEPGYLWLGLPVVFFIIYIRYAEKAPFKVRVIDKHELLLSTNGIQYGEDHFPVESIEAVALYLYAFENFEYRDGFVYNSRETGVYVRAHGDQNKISFRVKGRVFDFDFYIDDYARFIAVRNVISNWSAQGVNVVLKQVFDDEFMIGEMNHYNTPVNN